MIKFLKNIYIIPLIFLLGCSFDQKTGIWSGADEERKKIAELEYNKRIVKVENFSLKKEFEKEINLNKKVQLRKNYKTNNSWPMPGLNLKNSTGNLAFSGELKSILKKRIGKNKF